MITMNQHHSRISCYFLVLLALWLFVLLTPSTVQAAQSITEHAPVNMTATASDFNAGEKVAPNNLIQWTSDIAWIITVKSLDSDLGQSNDFSYTKPLSDLKWKRSTWPFWLTMTTTDANVSAGSSGSGQFNVDYKVLLSWSADIPGSYGATIQYTISPN